jgi:4-hydroxy-2-oxovalerate aldolase
VNAPLQIVDCTLRDGSYAIDYQWTAADTRRLCSALQHAGVRMIEIGHGVGLNGSSPRYGVAAASDEDYCDAAASVLGAAQFGAFFIPGIGRFEDLTMARARGMGFVRIGTNVTQIADAQPFVAYAKRLGFHVSYNAMKSYLLPPREFAETMRVAAEWGADALYVVDSAGCLLPDDVTAYVSELRARTDVPVGFHGHNNLTLAGANCVAAYRAGATLLDATLQGIGRGGGNAQTEALIGIFEKLDVPTGIDLLQVLQAGKELVRPRMDAAGVTSTDVAMGMGAFHSSFLPRVEAVVRRIPVDMHELIIALGDVDRLNPSDETIERVARQLAALPLAALG